MSEGRSDLEKQSLGVILAMLGVMIVGLVVIIAVMSSIMNVKTREELEEEGLIVFGEDTETTDCRDLDKLGDATDIGNCLFYMAKHGESQKAFELYAERIDKEFARDNYELALGLITNRSSVYFLTDRCKDALAALEDARIEGAPDEYKIVLYDGAIELSAECGDEEKRDFYVGLVKQLEGDKGVNE